MTLRYSSSDNYASNRGNLSRTVAPALTAFFKTVYNKEAGQSLSRFTVAQAQTTAQNIGRQILHNFFSRFLSALTCTLPCSLRCARQRANVRHQKHAPKNYSDLYNTKAKIYFSLALLFTTTFLFSKDVDENYALQVAKNFYLQNNNNANKTSVSFTLSYKEVYKNGLPVYYVFNANNNNGFVIVSGDDLVQPILAYSTTGSFFLDSIAPATVEWMDNYKNQIIYVKENLSATTNDITQRWNNYYQNIILPKTQSTIVTLPLTTKWWQGICFNNRCPIDNSATPNTGNNRCLTGCVATAMAQIMNYWNYPSQGNSYYSYNSNYGTLSVNFGNETYDWLSMPKTSLVNTINNTQSEIDAVAKLVYDCGVSVNMEYGPDFSGSHMITDGLLLATWTHSAENAYKTYFGYNSTTIQGLRKSNYSDANWKNLLKNELNNGRPIQYAGAEIFYSNFLKPGAHSWVCYGYDDSSGDLFNMNWGWGGQADGLYSLSSLVPTPSNPPYDFSYNQEALIGIQPSGNICSQPSDDDCAGNYSALPLNFGTSCNPTTASTCGATSSGFSSCVGTQDDDIFFSFVPTTSNANVTVVSSSGFDAVFQVLTGPCGTSMQQVGSNCIDNTGYGGTETTTVNGLIPNTKYFIRVWNKSAGYGTSHGNFSICVNGNCNPPSSAPVLNTPTVVSSSRIDLSWSSVTGATYDVYYSSGSCPWTSGSLVTNTSNLSASVTGLTAGNTYHFVVVAKNSCGSSGNSNCQSATT